MPDKITLTVIQGKLKGRQFIFDCRNTCIIGRNADCNPQLPDDEDHRTISRYHCLLDINPPAIRVRDFGSKNGTYINNEKIGQRQADQNPEEGANVQFPEYDLQDGDEIKLGHTVFKVTIEFDKQKINIPNFIPSTIYVDYDPTQPPTQPQNLFEKLKRLLRLAEAGDNNLNTICGYQIVKLLGEGGFGEVYLAQHNKSGKFVALKVMSPAVNANQLAIQMFLRETENTKALRHPNVVQLIDYGYFKNIFFFTMEYCQGGSLSDLVRQQGGLLSIDIAVPITLQILDGLEYTHNAEIPYVKMGDGGFLKGRGLVHRDLKPSNIFLACVDEQVIAKIGDYGLSKAFDIAGLSGQTLSGTKAGTPIFIPRQQVLNFKYVQPDVDIWATAACLYYMLTGTLPRNFTGGDPFLAVLQNDPVPIRQKNPLIPQKLADVIDLALVEKPEIYFKSATAFKQALLGVL
ncbi:protein kinase domain-containing protein [Nostoc sp. FACHB-190]|uniref:protein kinase domain-containing protein n=1 Tax=Nostoc sp. FACHB-190 TaxID=2692838 RepID=UPI001682A09D|nr:protein kinase [Nostoc sp. FACHB-190]MBD2297236.1 protein kinase [Nostoc sp. FACHB-190]